MLEVKIKVVLERDRNTDSYSKQFQFSCGTLGTSVTVYSTLDCLYLSSVLCTAYICLLYSVLPVFTLLCTAGMVLYSILLLFTVSLPFIGRLVLYSVL